MVFVCYKLYNWNFEYFVYLKLILKKKKKIIIFFNSLNRDVYIYVFGLNKFEMKFLNWFRIRENFVFVRISLIWIVCNDILEVEKFIWSCFL